MKQAEFLIKQKSEAEHIQFVRDKHEVVTFSPPTSYLSNLFLHNEDNLDTNRSMDGEVSYLALMYFAVIVCKKKNSSLEAVFVTSKSLESSIVNPTSFGGRFCGDSSCHARAVSWKTFSSFQTISFLQ